MYKKCIFVYINMYIHRRKGLRDCADIELNYAQLRPKKSARNFRESVCKFRGATQRYLYIIAYLKIYANRTWIDQPMAKLSAEISSMHIHI